MIRIVVDSICDLPQEILSKMSIDFIPLRVLVEDREFYDKVDIESSDLYEYMERGVMPKTSQPKIDSIKDTFESILKRGDDFLYLAFSSKMSGSCQTAHMIAQELKEEYPQRNMRVLDSKSGTIATGLMVMALQDLIDSGADFEEVVKKGEYYSNNVCHLFTLTNLNWLSKGGRLSKSKAVLGSLMNIKPILTIVDGEIINNKNVRGEKKAVKEIIEEFVQKSDTYDYEYVGIGHSNDLKKAQLIKNKLQELLPDRKFLITDIGSVLTTHLGIGGVGILGISK